MAAVATNGANNHASREARRRRIMERGSDRLALITGRIQSLPPDPDQARSTLSQTPAGNPSLHSAYHEEIASIASLSNQESGREPSQHDISAETVEPLPSNGEKTKSTVTGPEPLPSNGDKTKSKRTVTGPEPLPSNGDKTKSTVVGPEASQGIEEELSQISSSTRSTAQDHLHEQSHRYPFTTVQIREAITTTENIRTCCSIAAAILVILSYIGFPVLGCHIFRSVITFRPVYLLLLTNISIVLARLILATQGAELRMGPTTSVPTFGGNALVGQLGKALELGLLVQNISRALFMDFSIYVVMIVCSLSLARRLGW